MKAQSRLALIFIVYIQCIIFGDELLEEETEICQAVRIAEKGTVNLSLSTMGLTIYEELSEVKNTTIAQLRAQIRTQALPFALFARHRKNSTVQFNNSKSSTCFFSLMLHINLFPVYLHPDRNFKYEWITPAFDQMNSLYFNHTSKLDELEIDRNVLLMNPGDPSHFATLQSQCRQINPEYIFLWIYEQTAGNSNMRHLIRATLQGRQGKFVNRIYQNWSWTVLNDLDRSAYLSQICSALQFDEVIPSEDELEREADWKVDKIGEVFDRLIETERVLLKDVTDREKLGLSE